MKLKVVIKDVYHSVQKKINVITLISKAESIVKKPSYFPEKSLKSDNIMLEENKKWIKKYGELNEFYKLYRFDLTDKNNMEDYIDYLSFMNSRNIANNIGKLNCHVCLLRDKFLFYKYMKSNNLPVPEVFGIISNGKLLDTAHQEMNMDSLYDKKNFFVKDIDGECASFVKRCKDYSELKEIFKSISNNKESYILQESVIQAKDMDVINPNAINTLRIVTINKDGNPYVLSALLRVGTSKTGNVDNWAAGGLAIGINKEGYLKKYGFYKPIHGTKDSIHPDTKIVFSKYKVPQLDEAYKLVIKAHKSFYGIRAIGWDIAITDKGPVFIEGNDNFEISLMQACDRPLRKEWEEAMF